MAVNKNNINSGEIKGLSIEFDESYMISLFEKEIDRIISEKYIEGQHIKISFDECLTEECIEEISESYENAGWEVFLNPDDYNITLI